MPRTSRNIDRTEHQRLTLDKGGRSFECSLANHGSWCAHAWLVFDDTGLDNPRTQAHSIEITVESSFNFLAYVDIGQLGVRTSRGGVSACGSDWYPTALLEICLAA